MSNAIAIINKQSIIDQLSQGLPLVTIAASLNVTPGAISQQLSDDPDYLSAREDQLDTRMVQREALVEQAMDMLNLARAKELLRHSEFRASVECPKRWGKNVDVQVLVAPVFNVIVSNPSPTYVYDEPVSSQSVASNKPGGG